MKPYIDRGVRIPDELIVSALAERLGHFDAVKRGWVLHGFPSTRAQGETLGHLSSRSTPDPLVVLDSGSALVKLSSILPIPLP